MNERQMHRADFLTGIVLLVFGVTVTVMSIQMPRLENKGINPYTVPGLVPGLLGVIIGVMSMILVVRSIINRGYELNVTRAGLRERLTEGTARRLLVTLILTLIYALLLIGRMPYTVATFLFTLAFVVLFEWRGEMSAAEKRKVAIIATIEAVVTALVVAGVFQYLFLVDLP